MLISIDQTEGFNPDDYAAEEEKPQEDLVPVSFAPMKMREDLSLGEEFGRGFDRGLLQTKGLGLGLVGALGAAAGLDDVEEYGYTGAQEAMQAASAPELAGEVMSIFDVGSPGDFMHYAAGIMGSQVPNLAISAVTGGVGGMVGKRAVSAAITEALEAKTKQLVGEGVAKEVAKRQAQVALSREMGVNMAEKLAAEKAAQIAATKAGIGVGAAASGVGMEVGSIYSETRDLGLAVKYGVPAGLVEGITTRYFGGKIVDAIEGTGGKKGLMAAGREIGKGIGIESAQEGVQTALELQALEESGVKPGFKLFSEEGARGVIEGVAAGAVMGGGMATGVQGLKLGLTPLTQRALRDAETGLPPGTETPGTEQQDTTEEEKFYNFSPDAVVIDDGDDDPITARRFTIGTETGWAIDNPTEEMKRRLVPLGNTGKVALVDGGKDWGSALKLILHNGGRVRNIDPSILDNRMDDDGEYVGLSSFTQDNKLGAGTGQQQGKVQGTDMEIEAEQRAFEDQLISKYSQLNNVLNATELLESTGVMPQGSFTGSEREALGGGLNQDERAAILAAVPSRELTKSKAQVERLIRETEEAAAKEGTTPELERQLNFLADVQGRIADFENLKTMQQTLGRKPLEGTAPGDLSAGVSKTDANAEKLAEWSRIVDGRAMALSDLFDTRAKLPKFENQDFEALDAYEMMLADIKNISDEMDSIREAAASAGGSIDPKMLAAKAEQLRQAEMAARELIDDGGPNDVFARSVREKLKKEETKNSKAFDRWFNLNATAENLQDERNELVTQEDIENFDKSYKGKRLERISKVLDDAYDRVVPASVRSAIYEEAAQQARVARGDNEPAAAQRPAIEKELAQLDSKVEGINTRVVYKTPEGNTVVGTLVPDPETGKALDKNGNLVFAPNAFKVGKDSLGNDLTDLADTRPQYERFIRIPKEYAGNIVEDKAAAANARAAREAEKLGVENAKQNTLVQNATAAAAKLNEQSEARDKELDASLEPVFSKDPQGKWQSGVKRGDVVGLKLDDQGKVHRTEFLSDKTRLVPTNAGIYRGMENGEVVFDRYYIAKPKGGKAPKAPNSLALPQLRPGETFVTLSDLDPAEIERLAIPTSERVPQDLWDNLYKAPKTAIFGTAQVPKGGMVQRPARRGTRMKQTPTIVEDETGDLEVQDVFTFEGDLTNPEEILTVALGKVNMTPTREELISAGFTPTGETQEFQVGRNYRESEVYDTTIKDPLSKSGLDIPVKAGLFKDSKNPDAPALVKLYAEFDPSDVYEAMEELEAKRTAPDTAQKNANIVRAEQSLAKAVQDLRFLTLAQMNMGLDVRVREINGIPEAQFLSDFGFVAERSGGKKGAIGNHIVTEVSYNPNPDFKGGGDTFRRKVQTPRLTQQRAAETLTNMTLRGRGFDAKKSGLGVANNVLGNFRRQTLEIAQEAKEKQQTAIERGSDLASRHAESLVRLTAFTRPMFERYAVAIRKHIEEAQGSTPEFKDRWLLEAELRLARELNKTQLRAMPDSVATAMQSKINTEKRKAEKIKPVEGKRRILKKGKNYGDLVDDPKMRGRRFQRATRTWKQKLDDKIDEVEETYFRQMLPRAVSGNTGVSQVNKLTEAIEKKKAAIRQSVAATKIAVKADQAEVAKQINNDQEVKRFTAAFQKSKGDAAKKRWKAKLDARKAQIENNAIVERAPTEGEIETETRNKIQQNSEIRSLEQQLEKLGELSRDQEAMIDEFLDYIQARAEKTKNENRKALTERLLVLLNRKKVAEAGGRRIFVNVSKEDERIQKAAEKRQKQLKEKSVAKPASARVEKKAAQIRKTFEEDIAAAKSKLADANKKLTDSLKDETINRDAAGAAKVGAEIDLALAETSLKDFIKKTSGLYSESDILVEEEAYKLSKGDKLLSKEAAYKKAAAKYKLEADIVIAENDEKAAEDEDRIDSAAKAMEFAQTTGNAKLFEKAAQDFTARAAKATKRFSEADKRIIEAYGKMMDEVKTLNIFGTTGRVPGILRQGFNEAKEFQGAIEKQELYDPETGKALDIGSDAAGKILKGQKDPLAFENYREPKKGDAQARQEYIEALAARRLKELAESRLGNYGEVDPNLVELALVKLFGGKFEGQVEGREIDKTFPPLPKKFVDPLLQFMEGDKGQTENQKIIREAYSKYAGEILDTYLFDSENDSFAKAEPLISEQLAAALGPSALASAPGASGTDVAQSNKNATAQPDRNPTREGSKAAVQSFVQGYAGLTDSDMVALDDREVDAIYQAATSKADADMAAGAVDSVVAATPGIDALLEMSGKDLMRGYLRELEAEQTRGDAETILRENLRRAATTKMFKSNSDFLEYVSKMPQGIKRAAALRAKEFLKLNGQGGFNWNKIATQIAAFGKDGKQATWAGLLGTDMETGGHAIYLNLDQIHEGDIVETMLEEMDHALTHRIINAEAFGMKLNSVQQSARDRLRTDFKRAVLKAGEGMTELAEGARGFTPEQKVAFYSNAFKDMVAESPDQFRAYYNLTNLDEFVVGIKKDGSFIDLLKELGFSEKAEGGFSLVGLLKNIFTSLAELVTGRRLDANSELARAFSDAWTLSTGRDKTQWTVPPTQLSMALGVEATGGKATGSNETVRMRKEGGNAVYNAYLQQNEDGSWSVFGEFGDSTRKLQRAEKSKGKLDYEQAKAVFDKTVEAKSKKYSVVPEGPEGPQGPTGPNEGPQGPQGPTGPAPESAPGRAMLAALALGLTSSAPTKQQSNIQSPEILKNIAGYEKYEVGGKEYYRIDPSANLEVEKAMTLAAEIGGSLYAKIDNTPQSRIYRRVVLERNGSPITEKDFTETELQELQSAAIRALHEGRDYIDYLDYVSGFRVENDNAVKSTDDAGNWFKVIGRAKITRDEANKIYVEDTYDFNVYGENKIEGVSNAKIPFSIRKLAGWLGARVVPEIVREGGAKTGVPVKIKISDLKPSKEQIIEEKENKQKGFETTPREYLNELLAKRAKRVVPVPQKISGAPQSAPGRRSNVTRMLLGKKEGTTYTGKKVETGGYFASDALATDGVTAMFDRKTNRESFGKQQAEFYGKALGRALKKYEGQFNPNDVNDALGSIENPLTEAQAREIDELVATNQEADAAVLKNDYMEANRADFRRRQAEARKRLPEEVVKIIEEMRDTVDPLSSYADEKMGFSTAANQGIYLNRAYLIFGDEKTRELHQKQIRENPVVMENLKNYLSRQLAEQDAEALIRRATREGRILPREEALVQATANLSPTDLGAAIERVLNAGDKGVGSLFVSGRIPGQKNLKIFDARGNIAKEIQAAWGVVEDPGTNYANTVIKLANLVANDKFLQELKAAGLESGTLYDPRDPKNLNEEDGQRLADARSAALEADPTLAARSRFKPELLDRAMIAQDPVVASILEQAESKVPSKYVKLSGETNKSFAPVSGMYAEPLLFEWLTTKFPPRGEESWWMKALTQATLVPMAMKTVGSVTGQFRNYYSGYMSLLSNNNLRFWDPEWWKDFSAAHRMTFGEIYRDARGISTDATARKAMMKARERFSELGLTGQSVTMNFMQDLARLNSGKENGIVKGFDGLVQKFIQTYGASDDNFKIIHYFSELGKYRRAFPDMPQAQLEEKAAAIARGIHQTYGDTYSAVKSLKKVPFIAPFISFTSEVIRNTIYSGRLAWNEVKEGRATGNRELERIGLQRFAGMSIAGFGTFALTSISASLVGISGEEEREFRKLLPEWQRNSQLLFTGKENGKIRFADFSFSDPLSYLKTPAIAFSREIWSGDERSFNEKVGKGILNAMQTLASPFVSEQLFSGSLMQLYSNKDGSGREIVNWQDDPAAIAGAVGGHLIQPFLPGTFDSLGRIGKAFTGYVSPSGRSYDKGNEIMSFFGARISEVDVRQSLGFKTKAFMQNYREAAELFTGPFLSRGTQDSESIVEGYESANSAVQRLFGELRGIYLGAVRLGVPQREVLSILKANGLSEENLAMLRSGKFKPYQASKQAIAKNREAGMQTRISDYNKAYAAAQRP